MFFSVVSQNIQKTLVAFLPLWDSFIISISIIVILISIYIIFFISISIIIIIIMVCFNYMYCHIVCLCFSGYVGLGGFLGAFSSTALHMFRLFVFGCVAFFVFGVSVIPF